MTEQRWRIVRHDAGMGETEYRLFRFGEFFAQIPTKKEAQQIILWEKVLDELVGWIKEYQSGRDSAYMEVVLTPVLEKIAELRKGGRAND